MISAWTKEIFQKIISDLRHIDWHSNRTRVALKTALATPAAVWVAWLFNITNPYWAGISALVVVQSFSGGTIVRALDRTLATIVAAALALLIFGLFNQNIFLLMGSTLLVLTVALYYSRKTDKLYAWLLGPATFLLIIFSVPPMLPFQVSNEAYYRILEVAIGSSCAVVFALIFPIHSYPIVQKNNLEMVALLKSLYFANLDRYQTDISNLEFYEWLDKLSTLADMQTTLRRSIQQEALLNLSEARKTHIIEQMAHTLYEIIADSYDLYHTEYAGLQKLFTEPFNHLRQTATETFIKLDQFLQHEISLIAFQEQIGAFRMACDGLVSAYAKEREASRFYDFDIKTINQWQQFMVSQQNIVQVLENFSHFYKQPKIAMPLKERLTDIFNFDRLYWLFGFKTALLAVGLTLTAVILNLPGAAMIGVVIIIVSQFDVNLTKKLNYFSLLAFAIGAFFAMVVLALSITNLAFYLLIFAICIFVFSYFIFVDLSYNYFGALAAVAFIVSIVSGTGPITDWRNAIILSLSTIIALIIFSCFDIWVWPYKVKDLFQHYELQLLRFSKMIEAYIHDYLVACERPNYKARLLLRSELNLIRQNIREVKKIHVPKQESLNLFCLHWHRYYFTLSNLMLALLQLNIPPELQNDLPVMKFAEIILNSKTTPEALALTCSQIQDWKNQLRTKALQGDPLLPVAPLLGAINFLSLLQKLIYEKNTIAHYRQEILQNT